MAIVDTLCLVLPASSTKRLFGNSLATTLGRIFLERKQADADESGVGMKGSDFQALKFLGRGSYGKIFCVRNSISGKTFAEKSGNQIRYKSKKSKNYSRKTNIIHVKKPSIHLQVYRLTTTITYTS